jgi:hypothetical protein
MQVMARLFLYGLARRRRKHVVRVKLVDWV